MRQALLKTLLALAPLALALAGCPGEGNTKLQEVREEVANEVGGAPKRQVDQAKARIDAAAKAQAERLEGVPTD